MKYAIIISIAFAVFAQAMNALSQEQNIPMLNSLKFKFDVQRAEARKPLTELQEKYDKALERIEISEQEKGNLKEVVIIREERKQFRVRVESPNTVQALSIFKKLRDIYVRESRKMRSAIVIREVELLKAYAVNLEVIARGLTRKGEIEEALKVSKIAETAREGLATLKRGSRIGGMMQRNDKEVIIIGKGGRYELNDKCELSKDGGRTLLTSAIGNAPLSSKKVFQTPFYMQARAETDSSLRFYFGKSGIVIFNWNMNEQMLKVGDPNTPLSAQLGFQGQGGLKRGQIYDFEIKVEKDMITVLVDRIKKAELQGDFAKVEGPIGIGPSIGKVWVEYFKGFQGKDEG